MNHHFVNHRLSAGDPCKACVYVCVISYIPLISVLLSYPDILLWQRHTPRSRFAALFESSFLIRIHMEKPGVVCWPRPGGPAKAFNCVGLAG